MPKSILIIDDFRISNEIVAESLQNQGYQTFSCQKLSNVFQILKTKKIDAVISDYIMPEMNGIDLMTKIREISGYERIPVIILSSETDQDIIDNAYNKHVTYWMKKPMDIEKLKLLLKKLFSR
ncbi:MAG: response regulator [Bacteroidales bacterium]|nr:response regulator [Bacteroidales bacterium]